MGDFRLITSRERFYVAAQNAWNAVVPGNRNLYNQLVVPRCPVLVAFYIINYGHTPQIASMSCGKQEAKRVVYHKTNKNRVNRRTFSWLGKNIKEETQNYITVVLQANQMDPTKPEQEACVLDITRIAEESTGPGLIAHRKYPTYPTGTEIIGFFIVTIERARRLIYHNHHDKEINTKKLKSSDYYNLNIDLHDNIQITLLYSFNLQPDTFRFTSSTETDMRLWEVAAVRHINSTLAGLSLSMSVVDKAAIAKGEFDKFYAVRQYRRADYAIQYPDAWANRTNLRGNDDIAALLREARSRVLGYSRLRGVPRFTSI